MQLLLGADSWGAIVPHAPLLIPEVNPGEIGRRVIESLGPIQDRTADLVVLVSPHGNRSGVYSRAGGSLKPMSLPDVTADVPTEFELQWDLVFEWHKERLDAEPDHGIVVPLALNALPSDASVLACAMRETTGPGNAFDEEDARSAEVLARAIASIASERTVAVIASAHTSAALSDRAPLTRRPEAEKFEDRLLSTLERDLAGIVELEGWEAGDPCGRGPLLVLAHLFGGRGLETHAYDSSTGVGYLVASTR